MRVAVERDFEISRLVEEGKPLRSIADEYGISVSSVNTSRRRAKEYERRKGLPHDNMESERNGVLLSNRVLNFLRRHYGPRGEGDIVIDDVEIENLRREARAGGDYFGKASLSEIEKWLGIPPVPRKPHCSTCSCF